MQDTTAEVPVYAPLAVWVRYALIVFPSSRRPEPQCVAVDDNGSRCSDSCRLTLPSVVVGAPNPQDHDHLVYALSVVSDETVVLQRCRRHQGAKTPVAVAPEWILFDPEQHSDLIAPDGPLFGPAWLGRFDAAPITKSGDGRPEITSFVHRPTTLYRDYDATDRLLYVGVSVDLKARTNTHKWGSSWAPYSARKAVEQFATRVEAEAAEARAIRDEGPVFNVEHADREAVERRLVEYLVECGRLDLLVPAVRRDRSVPARSDVRWDPTPSRQPVFLAIRAEDWE